MSFIRAHKIISAYVGAIVGGSLFNVGLPVIGLPIIFASCLLFLVALIRPFSGMSGVYQPRMEMIGGRSYVAGSMEARQAQIQVDRTRR